MIISILLSQPKPKQSMQEVSFSAKLIGFLSGFSGVTAYAAILGVLFACGLGVPIPEDITLVAAGILAGLGKISLTGALIAGLFGVLVGDTFLFFLGRKLGRKAFQLPLLRTYFTQERIAKAEEKILANSKFICFTARFLPGLRAPVYLTSGVMGVKPSIFFLLDGFAALISVPLWVVGGWYFAKNLDEALAFAKHAQVYIIIAVLALGAGYFFYRKWFFKRQKTPTA
ncbi:MAG: DedA family protein [Bdellovibrionales bacterium]